MGSDKELEEYEMDYLKRLEEAKISSDKDYAEKSEKDKKLSKLFWMRIALGIIAGIATTFIFEDIEGEERRWASIGFMIIVFFGSIIVAKGMKMRTATINV